MPGQNPQPFDVPSLMAAVFPISELGPPDKAGYAYTVDLGIVRTQFDSGASRQRRTYRNQPTYFTLGWTFTTRQVAIFASFVQLYGVDWFTIDLPTPATPGDPVYVTPTEIRFISNYRVSAQGFDRYKVEINAEAASMAAAALFLRMYWVSDAALLYHQDPPADAQPFYAPRD